MFSTEIDGRTYVICTRPADPEDQFLGAWFAWSFFAYDDAVNIFPADSIPQGITTQESIAGCFGKSEAEASKAVENKLLQVIRSKSLDGTGFYSPPAGKIWPQDFGS